MFTQISTGKEKREKNPSLRPRVAKGEEGRHGTAAGAVAHQNGGR